jgi:hypothetical protein
VLVLLLVLLVLVLVLVLLVLLLRQTAVCLLYADARPPCTNSSHFVEGDPSCVQQWQHDLACGLRRSSHPEQLSPSGSKGQDRPVKTPEGERMAAHVSDLQYPTSKVPVLRDMVHPRHQPMRQGSAWRAASSLS